MTSPPWQTEGDGIHVRRVREVVWHRMWKWQAENACAKRFGISLQAAIYLVGRALIRGIITAEEPGHVVPAKEKE